MFSGLRRNSIKKQTSLTDRTPLETASVTKQYFILTENVGQPNSEPQPTPNSKTKSMSGDEKPHLKHQRDSETSLCDMQ